MKRGLKLTTSNQQRYITKVKIENFQSHEDTEFNLSPGVNLIVGSSEGGKSAILRAINFALHNEPRGDDFVRMERDETRVSIWWSDGCYLCRIKGANRNSVLIKDKDGFEQGFERIGTTLPSEALTILGNPPIDDESGPIAYADQHQPLFLVTLSASELPRTISRLTGIDDFEDAAELLNKKANAANKQIKDSTKRIEAINNQLKAHETLDEQLKSLEAMEKLALEIDEISTNINDANNLKNNYEDLMKIGRVANKALKQAEKIAVLSVHLEDIRLFVENIAEAKKLLNDYNNLVSLEENTKVLLRKAEAASNSVCRDLIDKIDTECKLISDAKALQQNYNDLIESGNKINKSLSTWTEAKRQADEELADIMSEMRSMGLWCSVCQRPKSMDACET